VPAIFALLHDNITMEKQIWDWELQRLHIQVIGAQVAQIVPHSMMNKIPLNSPLPFSLFCFVAPS
jgi:hypothetical protein